MAATPRRLDRLSATGRLTLVPDASVMGSLPFAAQFSAAADGSAARRQLPAASAGPVSGVLPRAASDQRHFGNPLATVKPVPPHAARPPEEVADLSAAERFRSIYSAAFAPAAGASYATREAGAHMPRRYVPAAPRATPRGQDAVERLPPLQHCSSLVLT